LLAGAIAAQAWMESGITDQADPVQALLVGFGRLARQAPVRRVFVPLWSAYPAVGFGDRDALPTLRSEAADRIAGWGRTVTWPIACLHLIAESARLGLRELDRLEAAAAEKGRGLAARSDKRSRLPDARDALLRAPVLTPKALATQLRIAPQTATALLRTLQEKGVVREVTGRGSFRAFAV
jgi:ribosomal protein S25